MTIANAIRDAATDRNALERELRAAFESFGFEVSGTAKSGEPDGIAVAHLGGSEKGKNSYRVSLEAKSKEREGAKVAAKTVGVSTVARHRDDKRYQCDHAFVLGPDFPKTQTEVSSLKAELVADAVKNAPKTITCCKVEDFALLLEIYPLKRLNLSNFRELLFNCRTPEETAKQIDDWRNKTIEKPPYPQILQELWKLQQDQSDEAVAYAAVKTRLRDNCSLSMTTAQIEEHCKAMEMMTGSSYITAGSNYVEMTVPPDQVIRFLKNFANSSMTRQVIPKDADMTGKASASRPVKKRTIKKTLRSLKKP